jgi:peptide/nickel transport system substrate-binding protein
MQPAYPYDPEAPRQLLAEAGWTDSDDNGWVDKDGESLKLTMIYSGDDASVKEMLAYMQEAWKEVGIEVEIENVDGGVLQQRLVERDFDLSILLFELLSDGSQGYLFSCEDAKTGFNYSGYCNSAYDELDERQKREFDPARRVQMQVELSQMIWNDLPVGPIRFGVKRTGYDSRIHNFFPNGYGFLWSLPFVWVESGS